MYKIITGANYKTFTFGDSQNKLSNDILYVYTISGMFMYLTNSTCIVCDTYGMCIYC